MKAQLKLHNGTPTVFFDDEPAFFGCHLVGYMQPDNLGQHIPFARQYAQAGVRIHSVDNFTHEWVGPGPGRATPYDFTLVEQRLRTYLEANPNALFLMRVAVDTSWTPSNWFNEAYPDEVEVLSNGLRRCSSFASARWRVLVNEALLAWIRHLRAIGLYDRVVAFQIGAGSSGEWIKDVGCMLEDTPDYSPAMRRYFQAWLRARYGSEPALQAAWADPAVTFNTAVVPSQSEQMTTATKQSFRDFRREQKVIDFYEALSDAAADDFISFAETVRRETNGEKLVGGFFGYVMELAWNMAFFAGTQSISEAEVSTMQRSGHLGLRKLLRSPAVDFLVSPHAYAFRGLGGDGLAMQPTESLRHHGKIYFMEEDALMHNNFDPGGRNQSYQDSIAVYQRNFANALTHGHAVTWFETNELHEHPSNVAERQKQMTRFQQLGRWGVHLDRAPSAEVAVFLDDESYYYESNYNNVDLPLIWRQRVASLNRFGAPHDVYYLEDLLDGRLPPYKLYVFLNAFHLNNARRAALKQQLRRAGRTALWLYAPGLLNRDTQGGEGDPDYSEQMTDLTGIGFSRPAGAWSHMLHVTNFTHPITQGLPQDWFWGSTNPIGPTFHVEDPQAVTLGQTVYVLGRNKPGFVVKSFNTGDPAAAHHSVYCASPDLPAPVLRGVARWAGVHLYSEAGDVLYATPELLSVHTVAGGPRTFHLPRSVELVHDLFNDRPLARNAATFDVTLAPASTALYFTGSAEVLKKL
ncbi:MAG: beta-galactosidase [Anaerolineales bacterium]|nr:beta-galactosidase [Anaerolineales bacterium]